MKKIISRYFKFIISIFLICAMTMPSFATIASSDGSSFVTKAEFDSALADFNSRLTTFEAGINSKIDSQVTSYLDRNGIWSGADQNFICPLDGGTKWSFLMQGGGDGPIPIAGPFTKSGLLFFNAPAVMWASSDYHYCFLNAIELPGWDADKYKSFIDTISALQPGESYTSDSVTFTRNKVTNIASGRNSNQINAAWARPGAQSWQRWAGISSTAAKSASTLSQQSTNKKEFIIQPSLAPVYNKFYASTSSGGATTTEYVTYPRGAISGGWTNDFSSFSKYAGQTGHYFIDTQMFVHKKQILWFDYWGYFAIWTDKDNPALFSTNGRDYGTRAFLCIY